MVGEFRDLAGHLHAGGTGPHDDVGEQAASLLSVLAELGHLQRAEDAGPQLQRIVDALHAGGERGELVVAEVGLAGPGCDDQVVVLGHDGLAQLLRHDDAAGMVDAGHLRQQDGGIGLVAQDVTGGRCDLAGGEDAGRHLVQQRLEQVRDGLGDQGDVYVGLRQCLGGEEPPETGTDDDYVWAGHVDLRSRG